MRLKHGTRLNRYGLPRLQGGIWNIRRIIREPEQMRKNTARFNELQHNGWTIIMVTADDLRTEESRRAS